MNWFNYFACFFSGIIFTNAFPILCTAFVAAVSRHHSLTRPAKDCYRPTGNVIWALFDLVVGYALFRAGKVWAGGDLALALFFTGVVVLSTLESVHFAKEHAQ